MTNNTRMPSTTELRIIHQFVDPHSTKNRTLEQILNEINDVNLIIKLIKHKQACDFYDQWKDHSDSNVRLALVSNGYFLDYYVHDEIDNIRHMAIYKQPKIRQKLLENPTVDELSFVQDYLYNESEPDRSHLEKYLDLCSKEYIDNEKTGQHEALSIKYSALTCNIDTIAKTMTPAQLFAVDHPAWAKTYYPETIAALCAIIRTLTNMGYQNRADYTDIVLNMVHDYQNDDYHYLQEFHSDAILEVKDRLGYPLLT